MFAMTLFGAKVDDSVNNGNGPYVFKASGQIYHWIGSFCPEEGHHPRFLQLYIYDTQAEVSNRIRNFKGREEDTLNPDIVEGYYPELLLKPKNSRGRGRKVIMNVYYKYQLHPRSRLDFIRKRQRELRSDYLLGLYSMYFSRRHVKNASWIDGNATKNIYWRPSPEIKRYMLQFPGFTPGNRADIVCRVFEQKVNDFLSFCTMSLEFQKVRFAHCHTLLWVDSSNKIKEPTQIDDYISAELPDPVEDPIAYKVITELMMHVPCGVANPSAVCTEKGICNKGFQKMYNDKTFFDINGHTHYRRRQTEVHFMKGESRLDNCNVVPYNRMLCLAFHAHINVEYCDSKSWHRRVIRKKNSIGRLTYVHPNSGDLFYFRMLMSHRKGCKSPIDVQTVNGQVLPTYRAACEALGLLGDDKEWDIALEESGKVSEATGILNYHLNTPELQGHILYELEATLNGFGKSVKEFRLPTPPEYMLKDLKNKLLMEEKNCRRHVLLQESSLSVPKLNEEHKQIYNLIMNASLRSHGKIVLAVASSDIASHFSQQDEQPTLDLIIWDEAPMNDKRCFEALDRTLRDLMNAPETVFGGKTVILGGDFRQTLPVKKGAVKQDLIHASIAESYLWPDFKVWNGEIGYPDKDNGQDTFWITVPQEYCISPSEQGLSQLIDFIYDDATLKTPTANAFQEKAIVYPKNDVADAVNAKILASVEGVTKTYLSRDEAIQMGRETSETEMLYPIEYLNTITFLGFPPHELQLKVGSPIMLLTKKIVNLSVGDYATVQE
ncbi:DNA helicase [Tanacetum coccineum]|uniref:ATP-dependent DNA helicase n=1 Tax=Tanacetum coccineum TaxID=301880 RepID=A0ABQ5GA06_9ASTR